ncbi:TPA: primase C-terminal domain-containing protein, partial [Enterobacter hormaechei subsp. steigerwaltii]|nr:primase C-terminal domain-containing protein [Enterobacter hormaechei subsp. steigerwaltii]
HGHWKIAVWQPELYTLDWLADFLDLNAANDKEIVADYGLGRNCTLFDKTRKWAYRAIRQGWPEYEQWLQACYERASAYNLQFAVPLDDKEVNDIAKSIAKWTLKRLDESTFKQYVLDTHSPEIQSVRGKRSKRGASLFSERTLEPWVELGISRRKYYYDKKK